MGKKLMETWDLHYLGSWERNAGTCARSASVLPLSSISSPNTQASLLERMRRVFFQFYKAFGSFQLDTLRPLCIAQEYSIEQRTGWLLQDVPTAVPPAPAHLKAHAEPGIV